MKNRNTNKIYRIYQSRKQQDDYCELKDISKYIIKYVLLLEDPSFFNHGAINIQSIYKAIQNNIKGGNIQGGSSIFHFILFYQTLTQTKELQGMK